MLKKYFYEIKCRLLILFVMWVFLFIVSYLYKETILFTIVQASKTDVYSKNLSFSYFIFTSVTEIFYVYIKIIFFFSFQTITLYFFYHLFVFLAPALYKKEYLACILFLKVIFLLWIVSLYLSNYLLIPLSWNFFLSFQQSEQLLNLYFEAKLNEYIDFYISLSFAFIVYLIFFSLLLCIINYFSNNNKNTQKFRKIYYYFFIIFSTLVSPPDIFSQILISFVTIFIYETTVLLLLFKFFNYKLILRRKPIKTNKNSSCKKKVTNGQWKKTFPT